MADSESFYDLIKRPIISLCESEPSVVIEVPRVIFGLRDRCQIGGSSYFAPHPGLCVDDDMTRDIDTAFCYKIKAPDGFRDQWRAEPSMACICEDMLDILLADERVTARQAFDIVMDGHGIFLENLKPVEYAHDSVYTNIRYDFRRMCIRLVHDFMENHRRGLLLDTLIKSGIDVAVIPSPRFHEYLQILKRSKLVLSANAALEYPLPGMMSCAMASGAVAACDGNAFIDEVFTDADCIPYSHNDYGMLADKMKEILANPSRLAEVSENGKRIIKTGYTTAHAVEKLVLAIDYSLLLHH
jgi:hypothetical protein